MFLKPNYDDDDDLHMCQPEKPFPDTHTAQNKWTGMVCDREKERNKTQMKLLNKK